MLIVALVLAVIGLAALVTAVVTSNELIAWVCIAASVIGVVLLIVDAIRDRSKKEPEEPEPGPDGVAEFDEEYPEEPAAEPEPDYDAETTVVEQADDTSSDDTNR